MKVDVDTIDEFVRVYVTRVQLDVQHLVSRYTINIVHRVTAMILQHFQVRVK